MRAVFLSMLVVLGFVSTAHGNMPPPGQKYLRYYAVITLAEPAGDWVYFVEPSDGSGFRRLGQARTYEIPSPGWSGTSTTPYVVVWAARAGDLAGSSSEGRLKELHQRGSAVCSGRIELGYWSVPNSEPCDGIDKLYRLERTDTELKLHPLGERTRRDGFVVAAWVSLAAGVVLVASWLMLRWRKRKARFPRTVPPPGAG